MSVFKTCQFCNEELSALYLDSHVKLRHPESLDSTIDIDRPVPHFSGLGSSDRLATCEVCGWRMSRSKLSAHYLFRHKHYQRGARNSRSPAVRLKTPPPEPVKAIKAATTPESLQAHSGWKQAKTEQSQDATGPRV